MTWISITPASQYLLPAGQYHSIVTWPKSQLLQPVNISYKLVNIFLLTHDQSISLISWSISFYCHMTQISITPASHYLLQAVQYLSTITWPEPQLLKAVNISYMLVNMVLLPHALNLNYSSQLISLTCWSIWFYCHMPWISITPAS